MVRWIARRMIWALAAMVAWITAACAQGALLQGGPTAPGQVPMYVGPPSVNPGAQAVVQASGPASGGGLGVGLSELNITSRGTGTGPFATTGTGPYGTHSCMFDTYATSPVGYHYLCFDPNAQGGGLIAYGAAGAASQLPLQFNVNGTFYTFPYAVSGIVGPVSTTVGDVACWNNTTGTLLKDCPISTTAGGNVGIGGVTAPIATLTLGPSNTGNGTQINAFSAGTEAATVPAWLFFEQENYGVATDLFHLPFVVQDNDDGAGGRQAVTAIINATSSRATDFLVGVQGQVVIPTGSGFVVGLGASVVAGAGADATTAIEGFEADLFVHGNIARKVGFKAADQSSGNGTVSAAFSLDIVSGAGGFKNAMLVGESIFPITSGGYIINVAIPSGTLNAGIDFHNLTGHMNFDQIVLAPSNGGISFGTAAGGGFIHSDTTANGPSMHFIDSGIGLQYAGGVNEQIFTGTGSTFGHGLTVSNTTAGVLNAAYEVDRLNTKAGFTSAILIGETLWPIATNGYILNVGINSGTINAGIDFHNLTGTVNQDQIVLAPNNKGISFGTAGAGGTLHSATSVNGPSAIFTSNGFSLQYGGVVNAQIFTSVGATLTGNLQLNSLPSGTPVAYLCLDASANVVPAGAPCI